MPRILLIALVLVAIGAWLWSRARQRSPSTRQFQVHFDDRVISVVDPEGEMLSIAWRDLTRVVLRSRAGESGPAGVFWALFGQENVLAVAFPAGAAGDSRLLEALQQRLPGFRQEEVVNAMNAVGEADYVLWELTLPDAPEQTP